MKVIINCFAEVLIPKAAFVKKSVNWNISFRNSHRSCVRNLHPNPNPMRREKRSFVVQSVWKCLIDAASWLATSATISFVVRVEMPCQKMPDVQFVGIKLCQQIGMSLWRGLLIVLPVENRIIWSVILFTESKNGFANSNLFIL